MSVKLRRVIFGLLMILLLPDYTGLASDDAVLWLLASERNYQNAKLVRFDAETQQITGELRFEPELTVIAFAWSPNMQYIAATLGGKRPTGERCGDFFADEICLFDADLKPLSCHEFAIANVLHPPDTPLPARISWSADSTTLYIPVDTTVLSNTTMTAAIDVVQLDIATMQTELLGHIEFDGRYIYNWLWFNQNEAILVNTEGNDYGMLSTWMIDMESMTKKLIEIDSTVYIALNQNRLLHRANEAIHIVTIKRDGTIQSSEPIAPENIELAGSFGLSMDGQWIAGTGIHNDCNNISECVFVFILDTNHNHVTLLNETYMHVDQITWAADNRYVALRHCEVMLFEQCHVSIFAQDGSQIPLNIAAEEVRDAAWR
jgi:hypothetical protein